MCPRPQYTILNYMVGTGSCGPMKIIFGSVISSCCTSLNIKFGANRTFDIPKIPVYRFGLYWRYQILWADEDNFWQRYFHFFYFHVLKTQVYRFDYYGRYRTLWTDEDSFRYCYLEYVNKSKYLIWYESDFPCAQDSGIAIWFRWELGVWHRHSPFSIQTGLWLIVFVFGRNCDCYGRTVGQADIAQMSQNFTLIKYLQGSQGLRSIFLCVFCTY